MEETCLAVGCVYGCRASGERSQRERFPGASSERPVVSVWSTEQTPKPVEATARQCLKMPVMFSGSVLNLEGSVCVLKAAELQTARSEPIVWGKNHGEPLAAFRQPDEAVCRRGRAYARAHAQTHTHTGPS